MTRDPPPLHRQWLPCIFPAGPYVDDRIRGPGAILRTHPIHRARRRAYTTWGRADHSYFFECAMKHVLLGVVRYTQKQGARVMTSQPLVTCIMPTRARPSFAVRAIALFLAQDYEPR